MTTDPQMTAWLDQEDAHLAQTIRTHRWAVQYVGGGDHSTEPAFGYTVGLFGMGHPELVVVGLGYDLAGDMLNTVGAMVLAGDQLVPGQVLEDDDDGLAPALPREPLLPRVQARGGLDAPVACRAIVPLSPGYAGRRAA